MDNQFKELLLETLRIVKEHPDAEHGIGFAQEFAEEPDWEVIISFVPKKLNAVEEVHSASLKH